VKTNLASSSLRRAFYIGAGTLSLGLGIIGAFLPIMPTTVFVLIAAACYARGSDRLHGYLLAHRIFGPVIHDWRQYRAIPERARWVAIATIVVTMSTSALVVDVAWVRVLLALIAVSLITFLVSLSSAQSAVARRQDSARSDCAPDRANPARF
jgi:uncharacterized membrane protein YbaN (DUF454 family)